MTDANGMNSDRLKMLSIYVDRLMGNRHDEGCYLDEYVDNVQAVATSSLVLPENYSLFLLNGFPRLVRIFRSFKSSIMSVAVSPWE